MPLWLVLSHLFGWLIAVQYFKKKKIVQVESIDGSGKIYGSLSFNYLE